jgi:hypothetical protein
MLSVTGLAGPMATPVQQDVHVVIGIGGGADANPAAGACDDCPAPDDPRPIDMDGDGIEDFCDCSPADPGNPAPGDVLDARFSDAQTLDWSPEPLATSYDVVRGLLSALPVGPGGDDEVCLATSGTSVLDATVPDPRAGFFYLVRGRNACGPAPDYGSSGPTSTCP